MKIVANSYFSGAGLFDIGLIEGGLDIQQSFEIDPICCETQRNNFSHEIIQSDITQKRVLSDKPCDVMIATYPCTKYSYAADIHGTRTGDDLFLHFFRHIALKQPEIYVVENVPGMKKFPVVMEALTRLPDYYVTVFCPLKAEKWLPQKRDRLILIGSRKNHFWRSPVVSHRLQLRDIIDSNPDMELSEAVKNRINGKYRDKPIISDPANDDIAPTCMAHYAKDRSTRLVVDKTHPAGVRPYSVREFARLQGVPDWFNFFGTDNQQYKQIGNGVPIPFGIWLGQGINRYFEKNNKAA